MTDIFISYSRKDEKQASKLVRKLGEKGFNNIWLDVESMRSGQLVSQEIQKAIQNAKDVVVLWSKAAASSKWVRGEAQFALDKEKKLHSLIIEEKIELPIPFNTIHALDFSKWDGSEEDKLFNKLLEALTAEARLTNLTKQSRFGHLRWLIRWQKRIIATIIFSALLTLLTIWDLSYIGRGYCYNLLAHINVWLDYFNLKSIAEPEMVKFEKGDKSFAIGKYEVTFYEFDQFCLAKKLEGEDCKLPDDEGWGRGLKPVINVSWKSAVAYAAWLKDKTKQKYRLPTEAEWEYAAREKGSIPPEFFWNGKKCIDTNEANYDGKSSKDYNCAPGIDRNRTLKVGQLKNPNSLGIHDMYGNVWEWVQDCWHEGYQGAPSDSSVAWEPACVDRVVRGGAWNSTAKYLRPTVRDSRQPSELHDGLDNVGFRLAKDL